MKAAVIGGGIFGCTAAIELARAGYEVDLYEERSALMECASLVNQGRFHMGYHYPRSPETIRECQDSKISFTTLYGDALCHPTWVVYALACGSLIGRDEYLSVLEQNNLWLSILGETVMDCGGRLNPDQFDLVFHAREARIDLGKLSQIIRRRLYDYGVKVHLDTRAGGEVRKTHDVIVVAAYAGNNRALEQLGCETSFYQYEVVEKPLIELPRMKGWSIVVMDGEFGCSVDEWGSSGVHAIGHVSEAILLRTTGEFPLLPDEVKGVLNGPPTPVGKLPLTKAPDMLNCAREYIPALEGAVHVSSMFTVRTVLAGVDDTDERPTLVRQVDDQVWTVLSGKIGTCVAAAQDLTRRIRELCT